MGNENSSPSGKQDRLKGGSRSAKPLRKIWEFDNRQCSSDSTESNASSTNGSQQSSESYVAKCQTYPPQSSPRQNCCAKSTRKPKVVRQLSRDPLSEHNLKTSLLSPQMTYSGKENQRLCVERRRSRSLCTQQLRADCMALSASADLNSGSGTPNSARRASNGVVQTLTRLRIQQCFKAAKPNFGQLILKRACTLRAEIRSFLSHLPNEKVDELANNFYNFLCDCVDNTDDAEAIKLISKKFGETLAQMSTSGFRPDYFTPLADAAIAECVKLDGGAHKRCETLSAWSQLIAVMFTNARDGYYETVRKQRRISLPQFQAKMNMNNLKERKKIRA